MKTTSTLIGGLCLALLAACQQKQEESAAKADNGKAAAETHLKPVAPATPKPATDLKPGQSAQAALPSTDADPKVAGDASAPATPAADAATTPDARQAARTERAEQRLASYDKDGDGKLTKEELPERMQRRFDAMDTNKDGVIDADEQKAAAENSGSRRRNNTGMARRRGNGGSAEAGDAAFGRAFGGGGGRGRGGF